MILDKQTHVKQGNRMTDNSNRDGGAFGSGCLYQVLSMVLFGLALVTLSVPVISLILAALGVWMFIRGARRARR